MIMTAIWAKILGFLNFPLSAPVWVVLAAVLGGYLFMTLEAADAARSAVRKYVAQVELEAAAETERGLRLLIEEKNRRIVLKETADREFRQRIAAANQEMEDLEDEIRELLARPDRIVCAVDSDVRRLLRNTR